MLVIINFNYIFLDVTPYGLVNIYRRVGVAWDPQNLFLCVFSAWSTYDKQNIILIKICCAFVGLNNKLCKIHGTYIKIELMNLGFVVPCIFKYSMKQPTRCTINLLFIALSRRHRSTCFGHCFPIVRSPLQLPLQPLDVLQAVVGLPTTAWRTSNPAMTR
jgi:hypothetical protein